MMNVLNSEVGVPSSAPASLFLQSAEEEGVIYLQGNSGAETPYWPKYKRSIERTLLWKQIQDETSLNNVHFIC